MIGNVGVHRAHDAEIVDTAAYIRENLADLDSALAVFLKFERRWKSRTGTALRLQGDRNRFACKPGKRGLRIEGVDVRGAPIHEQVQNALRFGRQRRLLRGKGV